MNPDIEEQFDNGITHTLRGQFDTAVECFKKILVEEPGYFPALVQLGKAFVRLGDFDSAIDSLQRAVELHPYVGVAHLELGYAYLYKGVLDEADLEFRRVLALEERNLLQRANAGLLQVYFYQKRRREAFDLGSHLLQQNSSNFIALYFIGKIGFELKKQSADLLPLEQAEHIVRSVLKVSEHQLEARYLLGEFLVQRGMYKEALESLRTAEGLLEQGTEHYFIYGLHITGFDIQRKLLEVYIELGQIHRAEEMLVRLNRLYPENADKLKHFQQLLTKKGQE